MELMGSSLVWRAVERFSLEVRENMDFSRGKLTKTDGVQIFV